MEDSEMTLSAEIDLTNMAILNAGYGYTDSATIPDSVLAAYKQSLGTGTPNFGNFVQGFQNYVKSNKISLLNPNGYDYSQNSGWLNRALADSGAGIYNNLFNAKETVYTPGSLQETPTVMSGATPVAPTPTQQPQQQTTQPQQTTQAQKTPTQAQQPALPQGNMTTGSIVDYLNSLGQNSSYASRSALAQQNGIQGYTGTAAQNTQLLSALRSARQTSTPTQQNAQQFQQPASGPGSAAETNRLLGYNAFDPNTGASTGTPAPQNNPANTGTPATPTTSTGQTATQNIIQTWSDVSKQLGLSTIQEQYTKTVDESKALQDKKDTEALEINNNPWYSEGKRQMELRKLDTKYEVRLNTLSNYAKLYDAQYQEAVATAKFLTTGIQDDQQFALTLAQKKQEAVDALLKDSTKLQSGIVGEYQYAVQNGYTGSFSQYQNEDANRKAKASGTGGLTPSQINTTVNSIAGAFDNEPIVKEYNTIKRNIDTFNNLGSSATDDIQRVYTFAKVADPNSAVKEGEYNSIEKYAQAVMQRVGLNVSRVFNATGILTPEARTAMQKTLQTSLDASQRAYSQVSSEYQRQVNDAYAGNPRQITNYSTPSSSSSAPLSPDAAYAEYLKVTAPSLNTTAWQSSLPNLTGNLSLKSLLK